MAGWQPKECPAGNLLGYDYAKTEECNFCGIQFRKKCIQELKCLGIKARRKPDGKSDEE